MKLDFDKVFKYIIENAELNKAFQYYTEHCNVHSSFPLRKYY